MGLEKFASEHTRLIYMTTGVLLQKLVTAKTLMEYSHIFIDEVYTVYKKDIFCRDLIQLAYTNENKDWNFTIQWNVTIAQQAVVLNLGLPR